MLRCAFETMPSTTPPATGVSARTPGLNARYKLSSLHSMVLCLSAFLRWVLSSALGRERGSYATPTPPVYVGAVAPG